MSRHFQVLRTHNNRDILTSTSTVITPNIDVSDFEHFSVLYQNSNTAIGFIGMQLQGAYDASATAADQSPQWFNIPSTTIAQPSALGATATVYATSVTHNPFKYLRVIGATCATAALGTFSITIAGPKRT